MMNEELADYLRSLWKFDHNRLKAYWDYAIDCNARRTSQNNMPPATLFAFVNEDLLVKITTFRRLLQLLVLYCNINNKPDYILESKLKYIENKFIQACISTEVVLRLHQYLKQLKLIDKNENLKAFAKRLHKLWFADNLISTNDDKVIKCSLFERVFVGRTKQNEEIQFNYWLQYYFMELESSIVLNNVKNDGCKNHVKQRIITVDYKRLNLKRNNLKPIGSMMIGTSPEFEFAMYTLCALADRPELNMRFTHYDIKIICKKDITGTQIAEMYPTYVSKLVYIRKQSVDRSSENFKRQTKNYVHNALLAPYNYGDSRHIQNYDVHPKINQYRIAKVGGTAGYINVY
ncbi:hypothetical protein GJ496_009072 [Pomphorhynchus laevis]|nr:hypothetical protein GJ496_009072 [Pomphorhynchus laevis]